MSDEPVVLVVDDDEPFRTRLARALHERGFLVVTAGSYDEAVVVADAPEYAVLDLRMPGKTGLELLEHLHAQDPAIRAVMLTGYGSIPTAVEATRKGAVAYLSKPLDADSVVRALLGTDQPTTFETPSLARAEWEYIHRVLDDCQGNVSEAARRLGIHRRSLQRKLQKHPPTR